jgi:sugar lactone lactonase YvrE
LALLIFTTVNGICIVLFSMRLFTHGLFVFGLFASTLFACKKQEAPAALELTYTASTLAGSGTAGFTDGPGGTAALNRPSAVALDNQGNVYVADRANHCIRKISAAGVVSTLAGTGVAGRTNGPGTTAQFDSPQGIAVNAQGTVYVADTNNGLIRIITQAGVVSTWAGAAGYGLQDGPVATARFLQPEGLALDQQGTLYIADTFNNRIRKITPQGIVSTVAGSGPAPIYVTENFADGPSSTAKFYFPAGIAVDGDGTLYIADGQNHRIRKISTAGMVSTLAGSTSGAADGTGSTALFNYPIGITLDTKGTLYVSDFGNDCIRRISAAGQVSTFAGQASNFGFADGPVDAARFYSPTGIVTSPSATELYVADSDNNRIRKITGR